MDLITSNFPVKDRIAIEDFVPGHLEDLFVERTLLEIHLLWIQTGGIHRKLLGSPHGTQQLRIEASPTAVGVLAGQKTQDLIVDETRE
jgi:hypothetical protein